MKKPAECRYYLWILMMGLFWGGILILSSEIAMARSDVIKWRCQVNWPPASASYTDSGKAVCNEILKRTNGRLVLELYPTGALVPPTQGIISCYQKRYDSDRGFC